MYKKLWKKIYGQCRMWANAAEITLDPVPFKSKRMKMELGG